MPDDDVPRAVSASILSAVGVGVRVIVGVIVAVAVRVPVGMIGIGVMVPGVLGGRIGVGSGLGVGSGRAVGAGLGGSGGAIGGGPGGGISVGGTGVIGSSPPTSVGVEVGGAGAMRESPTVGVGDGPGTMIGAGPGSSITGVGSAVGGESGVDRRKDGSDVGSAGRPGSMAAAGVRAGDAVPAVRSSGGRTASRVACRIKSCTQLTIDTSFGADTATGYVTRKPIPEPDTSCVCNSKYSTSHGEAASVPCKRPLALSSISSGHPEISVMNRDISHTTHYTRTYLVDPNATAI